MRLFAALEIPDDIKHELNIWWLQARSHLNPEQWRAVKPHQWHVTLAFYGDVCGTDADDLAEQLAICAGASPVLQLYTSGCGFFPRPHPPGVFLAGVDESAPGTAMKHLARCCRRAGHATVRRHTAREAQFRAHITLARAKGHPPAMIPLDLQVLPPPELHWHADHLCLFQSILNENGAQYRRLERFECRGAGSHT